MAIPSQAFADTARRIYEKQIPYKRGGKDLLGMDSGGFIEYCLKQHGVNCSFSDTNDLYRKLGPECIPLEQAIREKKVVPGAILLHVTNDGTEPSRYKHDRLGDCDFALIAISPTKGVYPSQKRDCMIETKIELVPGKANKVLLCKYIDYGFSDESDSAPANDGVYTTAKLNMRKTPSLQGEKITSIPKGVEVNLLEYRGEWSYVKYTERPGLWHTGWCASEYLTLD